ncbi:DUF6473 family protein [Jannaschia seohaensis]|uniref:DUF6473 domain-containing protein n=1 Tax=Jannaschia seohaensis TaxID=475081 RepID=A0A2Y9AA03_9RHOB|nr:DUF6473 family protein [Jannaschia seohaensis]PWJ20964.1 hypothetical protein BCF38_102211 [Jannaschia seohaensis]SSA41374.1 hypothetical protein SAMN05421539_102211 [Jannaschia seohaensis]
MAQLQPDAPLDYYPCRYGACRIPFRGPRVELTRPYTVVLGGSETYGKFVEDPFCDRVAELTHRRVVNLGVHNGGLDVFARDETLHPVIAGAETVIVQAMGAANLSNRFYTVHPRRNDRFLHRSVLMETLFQDVDFSDFAFTRHMLVTLQHASPDKFAMVTRELGEAWVARMRLLLSRIPGEKILLWIEDPGNDALGPEPLFVTVDMIQKLRPLIDKLVHCDVTEDRLDRRPKGLVFSEGEELAALGAFPQLAHDRVGIALAKALGWRDQAAA